MDEMRLRPSGEPPYWPVGRQVTWRSGRGLLAADGLSLPDEVAAVPHYAEPVTVVRDDADGLVGWLAAGTPVLHAARADGRDKREDKNTLFTAETVQATRAWADYDVLRIAPTGRPWSVWLFFHEQSKQFEGWYVNLEELHLRDAHGVYTSDHVLDVVVEPDRRMSRKDEDELALAVEQGRYDADTAAAVEADADAVEVIIRDWGPPFCDGWEHFRPDPSWPVPAVPPLPSEGVAAPH